MAEQPAQVQAGNLVIEGAFDISGKDIPEIKGFKVRVVYKDMADMKRHALRSSIIFAQGKIRMALRKKQQLPFKPGTVATMDSNGNVSLTPEEMNQRAIDRVLSNPEALRNATSEQRAKLAEILGLASGLETPTAREARDESDERDERDETPEYDEDELRKRSLSQLRAIARKHDLEDVEDKTKDELIEELIML